MSERAERADWGDEVLQEDTEVEVSMQLHNWLCLQMADSLEIAAAQQEARAKRAKTDREKYDRSDLSTGTGSGAPQWFKFHGQFQGHASAARSLRKQARLLREKATK